MASLQKYNDLVTKVYNAKVYNMPVYDRTRDKRLQITDSFLLYYLQNKKEAIGIHFKLDASEIENGCL